MPKIKNIPTIMLVLFLSVSLLAGIVFATESDTVSSSVYEPDEFVGEEEVFIISPFSVSNNGIEVLWDGNKRTPDADGKFYVSLEIELNKVHKNPQIVVEMELISAEDDIAYQCFNEIIIAEGDFKVVEVNEKEVTVPASIQQPGIYHLKVYASHEGNPIRDFTASNYLEIAAPDTTAPELNLPADITTEATGPNGAVVNFEATASDLVDGDVVVNSVPASGTPFGLGTTTVTCTATDTSGNTATGTFTITVEDTTAPVLSTLPDITREATSADGAVVTFEATASDLVDGEVNVEFSLHRAPLRPGYGNRQLLGHRRSGQQVWHPYLHSDRARHQGSCAGPAGRHGS